VTRWQPSRRLPERDLSLAGPPRRPTDDHGTDRAAHHRLHVGLRAGLLKCLAEDPAAVLLDLSGAVVDDDLALLGSPPRCGRERFRRYPCCCAPPTPPSWSACTACGSPAAPGSTPTRHRPRRRHHPAGPGRPAGRRAGRRPVRSRTRPGPGGPGLPEVGPGATRAEGQLVASELCANAVTHAQPPVQLIHHAYPDPPAPGGARRQPRTPRVDPGRTAARRPGRATAAPGAALHEFVGVDAPCRKAVWAALGSTRPKPPAASSSTSPSQPLRARSPAPARSYTCSRRHRRG